MSEEREMIVEASERIKGLKPMNDAIIFLLNDFNKSASDIGMVRENRERLVLTYQQWLLAQISLDRPEFEEHEPTPS